MHYTTQHNTCIHCSDSYISSWTQWGHTHEYDLPFHLVSLSYSNSIHFKLVSHHIWFHFNYNSLPFIHSSSSSSLHLVHIHSFSMNRNGYRDEKSSCYFHPKQVVVGVCPLCLNERLLLLAAKQGRRRHNRRLQNHPSSASKASSSSHNKLQSSIHRKPSTSSIHKIFAFTSLFSRPESRLWKSDNFEYDVSPSPEGNYNILIILLTASKHIYHITRKIK